MVELADFLLEKDRGIFSVEIHAFFGGDDESDAKNDDNKNGHNDEVGLYGGHDVLIKIFFELGFSITLSVIVVVFYLFLFLLLTRKELCVLIDIEVFFVVFWLVLVVYY